MSVPSNPHQKRLIIDATEWTARTRAACRNEKIFDRTIDLNPSGRCAKKCSRQAPAIRWGSANAKTTLTRRPRHRGKTRMLLCTFPFRPADPLGGPCLGPITIRRTLRPRVLAEDSSSRGVQFGALSRGEELLTRVLRRALQGRIGFIGPDALKVGFTPTRPQGEILSRRQNRRRLSQRGCCRRGNGHDKRERHRRAGQVFSHNDLLAVLPIVDEF